MDLAVKHKLNPRIIDVIKEHHAGSIVSYFYHKARNQKKIELEKIDRKIENPEDLTTIDEKNFRYPGDRPTTRESGIICIADSVESASRTLVKPTPARIRTLIDDIVRAKIDDKLEKLSAADTRRAIGFFAAEASRRLQRRLALGRLSGGAFAQGAPGVRGPGRPHLAVEQGQLHVGFERFDGLADRAGAQAQLLGGQGHGARIADRDKGLQRLQIGQAARTAGLACDNGVVVDESARTSDPSIYAIGDVTHLAKIFPKILKRLIKTGRGEWLDAEMDKLADPARGFDGLLLRRMEMLLPAIAKHRRVPPDDTPEPVAIPITGELDLHTFRPAEAKMASLHAKLARQLEQAPSAYYDALCHYLAAPGEEGWQALGLQGFADLACLRIVAMQRLQGLWPSFETHLGAAQQSLRAPARALSHWHLALALAAGAISGVVQSKNGRLLAVKGDTHKQKTTSTEYRERDDGSIAETRILTDKFVPVIRAWDLSPDSATLGRIITIH